MYDLCSITSARCVPIGRWSCSRGPAGSISLRLLVWKAAVFTAVGAVTFAAADRILPMRWERNPRWVWSVVPWLMRAGLAAWDLKAVRTWPYIQACLRVAGRNMEAMMKARLNNGFFYLRERESVVVQRDLGERPRHRRTVCLTKQSSEIF